MVEAVDAPLVTIVIPVLNDTDALTGVLRALPEDPMVQIVVVDGSERTDPAATSLETHYTGVVWLQSAPNRALQMNRGAAIARGRWILFLHADTRLADGWLDVLRQADGDAAIAGGSFRFALDSASWWARWIERGVRLRVRWFSLPYGDQAIFVRRRLFEDMGGYLEMPLMEDVDFVRRLQTHGRLLHADISAITSARRWERDGWLRRSVENVALLLFYLGGCSPERLARHYHRRTT